MCRLRAQGAKLKTQIEATRIFYRNIESQAQTVINRGGARSSKSYSLGQLFLYRFVSERGKQFLVVRKTLPALRISTYLMWRRMLASLGINGRFEHEKVNMNFIYGGNLLHFGSLDDPEKIKSTEWNYIWMEEANEFTYEDYQVLKLRLSAPQEPDKRNQIFLSFNPIDEFSWIKDKVVDGPEDVEEIHSSYRDNPFLSQDYIRTLEGLQEQDQNYYRIYALGEWGKLQNLVYTGWDVCEKAPEGRDVVYGLDFGFNNPSALVKVTINDGEVWEEELLYEQGLTNTQLIEQLKKLIPEKDRQREIYADSAEPARIQEIFEAGFNCHPAEKGPDSIGKSIDAVKTKKVHILRDSANLIKEKRAYSWKQDKNGRILDEPVKFNDHLMSAERYAIYSHIIRSGATPGFFFVRAKQEEAA